MTFLEAIERHAARFQKGRLLESLGKQAAAITEYKTLLKREPKYAPAKARLEELEK